MIHGMIMAYLKVLADLKAEQTDQQIYLTKHIIRYKLRIAFVAKQESRLYQMIFSEEHARIDDGQHELTKVKDAQIDHQKILEMQMIIDEALSFHMSQLHFEEKHSI